MPFIDFILHLDTHLQSVIDLFGPLSYVILFAIVFAETGLVVIPFLPGDSLLFVAGTLAGAHFLNIWIIYISLLVAAILGDTVNYWLGYHFGAKVFTRKNSKIFNQAHLEKTREFYEKYGGKTIILARFMPIIRTFAPFVAGIGKMHYETFILFNVIGGFVWVTLLTWAGYFFGGLPVIKDNFEVVVLGLVGISLLPMVFEYVKHTLNKRKTSEDTSLKEIKDTFKEEHLTS